MRRAGKRVKAKGGGAKPPDAKSLRNTESSRVRDFEKRLAEALERESETLEQQAATSEILHVISNFPGNLAPVMDVLTRNAARLARADHALIGEAAEGRIRWLGTSGSPLLSEGIPISRQLPSGRAILDCQTTQVEDVTELTADFPEVRRGYDELGVRTILATPLVRQGVAIGVLLVRRTRVQPFSDKEIALLQTFAAQAVIAIENVRLFTEVEARNGELTEALEQQTATAEILRVISRSPTDIQPVLSAVAESAARLCHAYDVTVFRVEGDVLRLVAHHGPVPATPELTLPVNRGTIGGRTVLEARTIQVADAQAEDGEFPLAVPFARQFGHRTLLSVPLMREGVAVGVIQLRRTEVELFTDQQIALLQTFADQAVIAIENVRLFTELQEKNYALTEAHAQVTEALQQQTATGEILRVIASSPTDAQPVFDTIARNAMRLCEGGFAVVCRYDGELLHLAAHSHARSEGVVAMERRFPMRPSRINMVGRAILTGAVVHARDTQADSEYDQNFRETLGNRSSIGVPMLRDGLPIGAIMVGRLDVRPFSDAHIALLQTFAAQAVIAIENVRLFTELQEKNRALTDAHAQVTESLEQQTATSDILRVISSSPTDVQPVFDAIVASATRLCGGVFGSIYRMDGELLHLAGSYNIPDELMERIRQTVPTRPHRGLLAMRALLDGVVTQSPDLEADPEYQLLEISRPLGMRSLVAVPMLRDGMGIGAIAVGRRAVGPFPANQIELLQTFADQAVIAIENVRLFQELRQRTAELTRSVDELRALGEVGRAVSSTLDVETVLQTIVIRANQLAGTAGCLIWEYDELREEFRLRASHYADERDAAALPAPGGVTTVPKGQGLTTRVMELRQPVQIPDIAVEGAYESPVRTAFIDAGHRALLGVPLMSEDEVIGVLAVTSKTSGEFAPESVRLLSTFATQSALAIQNARLFHEVEDKSRLLEAASRHKSEFLANMSHELRTPLNAILGFSEVLAERMFGEVNEKQAEYLQDILSSGRHLLSLINDILDLSKVEAGRLELELERFHLPTALDNALTLVRERATRHGIALTQSVDARLGDIVADERKVKQILLNLLSNAVKFTPEGGRVALTATAAADVITIAVSDTGIGIAPDDQAAIFEEFRQVGRDDARRQEGTGLGLTLAKKFVELHGGRIWVQSQVGQGATFTFTLPVEPEGKSPSDQRGGPPH